MIQTIVLAFALIGAAPRSSLLFSNRLANATLRLLFRGQFCTHQTTIKFPYQHFAIKIVAEKLQGAKNVYYINR